MSHLSDEAVAAFADDVLDGAVRERARKHCAECAECAYAVAGQREAIWALRAAPAPALSSDLLSRLREVPSTTPIRSVPTAIADDGTVMFASFGTAAAAFVPAEPLRRSRHRLPFVTTTAVVAVAAAITAGSVAAQRPSTQVTELRPALLSAHLPAHPAARGR